jgi:hypothetical protein
MAHFLAVNDQVVGRRRLVVRWSGGGIRIRLLRLAPEGRHGSKTHNQRNPKHQDSIHEVKTHIPSNQG